MEESKDDASRDTTLSKSREELRILVGSQVLTSLFATAWEFTLPLALLSVWGTGSSLVAPAALSFVVTVTQLVGSPAAGRWSDSVDRLYGVGFARVGQVCGTLASVVGLLLLAPEGKESSYFSLFLVLIGASVEALGSTVTKSAAKKDWAPQLYENEVAALSRATYALSFASQLSELLGPVIGACLLFAGRDAAVIGLIAAFAEIPAQLLLLRLYSRVDKLREARAVKLVEEGSQQKSSSFLAWRAWLHQPSGTALLATSFSLLFFTVLAPHGAVLTAYLATQSVSPPAIALFRALGAGAGVTGISLFSTLAHSRKKNDSFTQTEKEGTALLQNNSLQIPGSDSAARVEALRKACGLALTSQTLAASVAALSILFVATSPKLLFLFMGAVVFSRAGLYGYDMGYLELVQLLVDERERASCNGVEAAMCAAAELAVALLALTVCSDPEKFAALAIASALGVLLSLFFFFLWTQLWHLHVHRHHQSGPLQHKSHQHPHTIQQARSLSDGGDGVHVHLHYAGPRLVYDDHSSSLLDLNDTEGDHSHSHHHFHT